jgi:hypothetical protein
MTCTSTRIHAAWLSILNYTIRYCCHSQVPPEFHYKCLFQTFFQHVLGFWTVSLLSHVASVGNETKPETYLLNGADCRLVVILVRLPFHAFYISLIIHPSTRLPSSRSQW